MNDMEVILNYILDLKNGYAQKSISIKNWAIYENAATHKRKLIINLYESDLEKLLPEGYK